MTSDYWEVLRAFASPAHSCSQFWRGCCCDLRRRFDLTVVKGPFRTVSMHPDLTGSQPIREQVYCTIQALADDRGSPITPPRPATASLTAPYVERSPDHTPTIPTRFCMLPVCPASSFQNPLNHDIACVLEALESAWKNGECYHPIRRQHEMPSLN
jgi:hypothetical protein